MAIDIFTHKLHRLQKCLSEISKTLLMVLERYHCLWMKWNTNKNWKSLPLKEMAKLRNVRRDLAHMDKKRSFGGKEGDPLGNTLTRSMVTEFVPTLYDFQSRSCVPNRGILRSGLTKQANRNCK